MRDPGGSAVDGGITGIAADPLMMFLMATHWFADESKRPDYLIVAAIAEPRQLTPARAAMRRLVMRGQNRVHFTKESDSRREHILGAIADTEIRSVVYDAAAFRIANKARQACLERIMEDASAVGARRLVLETDEPLQAFDRRVLYAQIRKLDCQDRPAYEHMRASEEALLWIPDAIAWCWSKGGHWRSKARPLVADYHIL